jgi:predicted ABC-type ATPase
MARRRAYISNGIDRVLQISPLRPELAPIAAGRMVLRELNRLVEAKAEFAFESTLSGLHYAKRLKEWKNQGYLIEIVYIRLVSSQGTGRRSGWRTRHGQRLGGLRSG